MVFKKPNQPSPEGSASGRRWLSIVLTFGLLLAGACTDSPPAPQLKIDLAPSLERERSSYENDVFEAVADVSDFFSSSGFAVSGEGVIDSVLVFETSLAAREYLSLELGTPLEAIPETFAGTVMENRLFLVSRESYRDIWHQLYYEWPWTERTYRSLIVHEIAHRMHEVIVREQAGSSDAMGPVWFFEGLAVVCAKQFEAQQAPLSREALRQLVGSGRSPTVSYPLYGHIVRTLAAEFGVRRLVSEAAHPDFPEVLWAAPQPPERGNRNSINRQKVSSSSHRGHLRM